MTVDEVTLGGRLPLYDREALEPAQKELFDWLMNKAVPWAEGAGFKLVSRPASSSDPLILPY
jgi:4-carboxymuconolactone decarboxylase